MRSVILLFGFAAFLSTAPGASAQQAQSGGVFQPPEEQRRLGLPDKAAPAPEFPVAPLQSERRAPEPRAASPKGGSRAQTAAPAPAGEWTLECVDGSTSGSKKVCQAIVRSAIGNQVALVLSIARNAKGEVQMQMALPLGFAVQRNVEIAVGGFKSEMKVSRCTAQGCLVEGTVPDGFLDALREQSAGTARVFTVEGKPIDITLPTKGADAALADSLG